MIKSDAEDEEDEEEPPSPEVKYGDATKALAQMRLYIMSKSDVLPHIDAALHSLEDFVDSDFCRQRKRQSKLTDFFSKP